MYQHQGTLGPFPAVPSRPRAVNKRRITNLSKESSGTEGVGGSLCSGATKGHVQGRQNAPQPRGNL